MKILTGNSNRSLAEEIATCLHVSLVPSEIRRFSDSEVFAEIHDSVRGEDVFFVQPTSMPANDHIMELLVCLDALKRSSAGRITAVLPYYGYARQDRQPGPRTPISAKLVADLISTAGADRVLTVDLHAGQIQGFFDIPVDHLYAGQVMIPHIKEHFASENLTITSPDVGGVVRARAYAKRLGADLAIIDKRREKPGVSAVMNVIGDVEGRDCVIVDDIVDSAGTLCNAADALKERGARSVSAYIAHGVFSGKAPERIEGSVLEKVMVTNTIALPEPMKTIEKVGVVSIAPLLAEAIKRVSDELSIASLNDLGE